MVEDIFRGEDSEEDVILRGLETHKRDCLPPEQKPEYDERKVAETLDKDNYIDRLAEAMEEYDPGAKKAHKLAGKYRKE